MGKIIAIAAMDLSRGIAKNGKLPWHCPEDLEHFKQSTLGHKVLMGRKTYESLPKRPLKGRENLVASRDPFYPCDRGAEYITSLEDYCTKWKTIKTEQILWVAGGAEVYSKLLSYCDELWLTYIQAEYNCDQFFPQYKDRFEQISYSSAADYAIATYTRR